MPTNIPKKRAKPIQQDSLVFKGRNKVTGSSAASKYNDDEYKNILTSNGYTGSMSDKKAIQKFVYNSSPEAKKSIEDRHKDAYGSQFDPNKHFDGKIGTSYDDAFKRMASTPPTNSTAPTTTSTPTPATLQGGTSSAWNVDYKPTVAMPRRTVVAPDGTNTTTGDFGEPTVAYKLGQNQPSSVPSNNPVKEQVKQANKANANNKFMKALPFVTNVVNLFKKTPLPPQVNLDSPITLERVNMDNDRAMVERGVRGANLNADNTLDGQSANAVKSYNLATRFNQMSQVNQSERNQNSEIANKETLTNADISIKNNLKRDQYERDKTEMKIADSQFKMQNLSNAVDKTVGMFNEGQKANKDATDQAIWEQEDNNGVYKRMDERLKKRGVSTTPTYKFGGNMMSGNILKRLKSIKDYGTLR